MFASKYKWFNFLIIGFLIVTPIRVAMAEQSSHCEMNEVVLDAASHSRLHQQTDLHNVSHDESAVSSSDTFHDSQNCCCCDGDECSFNCDLSSSVSVILQSSVYQSPAVNRHMVTLFSSSIHIGEFSPPSRPPRLFS